VIGPDLSRRGLRRLWPDNNHSKIHSVSSRQAYIRKARNDSISFFVLFGVDAFVTRAPGPASLKASAKLSAEISPALWALRVNADMMS
jgi:hypothetical protein